MLNVWTYQSKRVLRQRCSLLWKLRVLAINMANKDPTYNVAAGGVDWDTIIKSPVLV